MPTCNAVVNRKRCKGELYFEHIGPITVYFETPKGAKRYRTKCAICNRTYLLNSNLGKVK